MTAKPEPGDYFVVWLSPGWQVVRLEKVTEDPTIFIVNDGSGMVKEISKSVIVSPFIVPQ